MNDPYLPASPVAGLIPTLNKTGWMTEELDEYSRAFAEYAGSCGGEALDIGCAYGVATLAALEQGAQVCACDMEPRHLDILQRRTPEHLRGRLRCCTGVMPDVEFPPHSFSAILASRVLHFLEGEDIEAAVRSMHAWLRPGGRVYLVADTPYTGPWYRLASEYEARKAAGERWPGRVSDYRALLPAGADPEGHPRFINPLDPDLLQRTCTAAGFKTLSSEFLGSAGPRSRGNEHAGIIAVKTADAES
ncbi:MAG: methyltransferase domain-containing protein [Gammaproteobacteria bacterium]|jgi:SAM-dependent methyltransferase|nr:methyltransferase domain-containing protein [Gammaproteobacteria bacterium]